MPSVCTSICGDSRVAAGAESCDDGNGSNHDGCGNDCRAETGYVCSGSPSVCKIVCGDGTFAGGADACDDGNLVDGDGCSALCTLETGYACTGSPSTCSTVCGDGLLAAGSEACDDGNLVDGDCCTPTCTLVEGCETEANNDQGTADPVETHFISDRVKGLISPAGDTDFYVLTLPPGVEYDLVVQTLDGFTPGRTCASGTLNSHIEIFSATGLSLGANDDIGGSDKCSRVRVAVAAGTYYVRVKAGLFTSAIFDYTLEATADSIVCGDGTVGGSETCDDANQVDGDGCSVSCALEGFKESEPNDSFATASGPVPPGQTVIAAITPSVDKDFFSFVVSAHADVEIETFDKYGPSTCDPAVNTVAQLLAPNGTTVLVEDDEDGAGSCAKISSTTDVGARNLAPGTYFVRVTDQGSNSPIPGYTMRLTFLAVCGDGTVAGSEECDGGAGCDAACQRVPLCGDSLVDAPEQCDDGNTVTGDGCSDTCQLEHVCGNGAIEVTEQCDDGNTLPFDGCDAACQLEIVNEIEPNNSAVDATDNGLFLTQGLIAGAIGASGDKDYFRFNVPANAEVAIETFDASGPGNCASINTRVRLYGPNGTTELASDDDDGVGSCSKITPFVDAGARALAAGKYFAVVEHNLNNAAVPGYRLSVRIVAACGDGRISGTEECDGGPGCDATCQRIPVCGDGFTDGAEECDDANSTPGDGCEAECKLTEVIEVEPNNSTAAPQVVAGGGVVVAAITPAGDKDFFSFTLTRTASVKLETFDSNPARTTCVGMDTVIKLYGTDGTTILAEDDDDGLSSRCSKIEASRDPGAAFLPPGTYYMSVQAFSTTTIINGYRVAIQIL